ncbi:MAG: TauD/TfdA dioxygenase family protein [Pseudomonadales bacterium]
MHAIEEPNFSLADSRFQHFEVTPVTPVVGATIEGLHLSELTDESAEELRQAVWRYGVVFAREQHLTPEQQKRVARCFAPDLEQHSFGKTLADEGHPEILVIEKLKSDKAKTTTDIWHHDVSARKHPNVVSVLQAKEVPFGADTMWASTTAAFDHLPHELKLLFLGLDIDHDTTFMALRHDFGDASTGVEKLVQLGEVNTHPAVIRHPFNDRLGLFIGNGYVKRVHGYTAEMSELILKIANELPKLPELQVRHRWRPGDVAIWDNFGTVHYGVTGDLGDQKRLLHRVAAWSPDVSPALDRKAAIAELMQAHT